RDDSPAPGVTLCQDLYNAYTDDPAEADRAFKGKVLTVRVRPDRVGKNSDDGRYHLFQSNVEEIVNHVRKPSETMGTYFVFDRPEDVAAAAKHGPLVLQ